MVRSSGSKRAILQRTDYHRSPELLPLTRKYHLSPELSPLTRKYNRSPELSPLTRKYHLSLSGIITVDSEVLHSSIFRSGSNSLITKDVFRRDSLLACLGLFNFARCELSDNVGALFELDQMG